VVLDNARDTEHVRPLLPGAPGCLALITSRNRLTGLAATEGAHLLTVDLLTPAQARDLLTGRLGSHRTAADPAAVNEIVTRCAGLPLALAIVAARAAAQPHIPLSTLAQELRETDSRLDALDGGDPATRVRAVFSWSYPALSADAAQLFRLLGLHPGPDTALAGVSPARARARALVTELICGNLLTEHASGRYTFHDLLRAYATELVATQDSDTTRRAATHRMLDHYLHSAHAADALLTCTRDPIALAPIRPGAFPEEPAHHQQALAWLTSEHPVILSPSSRPPPASTPTSGNSPQPSPPSSTAKETGPRWPPPRPPPCTPHNARTTSPDRPTPTADSDSSSPGSTTPTTPTPTTRSPWTCSANSATTPARPASIKISAGSP
jgi:hypothetical protein